MSRKSNKAATAALSFRSLRSAVAQGPRSGRDDAAGTSPTTPTGDVAWSVMKVRGHRNPPCRGGPRWPPACHRTHDEGATTWGRPYGSRSSLHPGLRDDPVVLRVEHVVADALRQEVNMLGREERHGRRLFNDGLVDLRPHL